MSSDFQVKLTTLELVYPPISNQEGVWLERDEEVRSTLRGSDLYLIGGRADSRFADFALDQSVLRCSIRVGDESQREIAIDVSALPGVQESDAETFELRLGDKVIQVWSAPPKEGGRLLEWFTLDKLAWEYTRCVPGLDAVDIPRELVTFDLLYVGIAKSGDTFDRLFARGHKARMDILANEPQRLAGARVADEIYLFPFRAQPLFIRSFADDVTDADFQRPSPTHKQIVADLEKALINQLRPPYNKIVYRAYPRGSDGVFGSDLDRYGYVIAEDLVFRTPAGELRGAREGTTGFAASTADLIFVEGRTVTLVRFEVDT